MLRTVAYVIRSFPEPSETFIAEEAASLLLIGIQPCILHLNEGNRTVVHPSAKILLERAKQLHIKTSNISTILASLSLWMLASPVRTIRTLIKAARHPNRWCYLQALSPAWWCRQHKVDFMHAHFADVNFQYAEAMSEWNGIPFGVTTHRYDILNDPIDPNTASKLYKKADVVVTISEFNRRYMIDKFGLLSTSISIVHCGIDVKRFAFANRQPRMRTEHLRLLNVGRLVSEKGQDILLRALARVHNLGIRYQLDIVGGGALKKDLLALCVDLGISEHVVFHDAQPEQFIRHLHEIAHVFVLPSRSEGLPVACIEALAIGTPTIATRINGIPELIEDGINGLLVEPEDVQGLADAICKIEAHPELAEKLRIHGRKTVLAGFDRNICTQELVSQWAASLKNADNRY